MARKKLQYAIKDFTTGQPVNVSRERFVDVTRGHTVTRRHVMRDRTRVFQLSSGAVVYMQYQTAKQARNFKHA